MLIVFSPLKYFNLTLLLWFYTGHWGGGESTRFFSKGPPFDFQGGNSFNCNNFNNSIVSAMVSKMHFLEMDYRGELSQILSTLKWHNF